VETVDAQAGNARPDFYGINCAHPDEFAPALDDGAWTRRLRSLRPNAAMADKQSLCRVGHLVSGDPQALGAQIGAIARRYEHLDVFGGCCGTWDEHLHAIAPQVAPHRGLV
jgi:methionine synthase I (cobalamin-dependent)